MVKEENKSRVLECLKCGHEWRSRTSKPPGVCPECKSPGWDVPERLPWWKGCGIRVERVKRID